MNLQAMDVSGRAKTGKCMGRTCGAMDNASDYGSEDSRFESWQVRQPHFAISLYNLVFVYRIMYIHSGMPSRS